MRSEQNQGVVIMGKYSADHKMQVNGVCIHYAKEGNMLTEPDIDPKALENISIPVMVTAGEHDLILPEETKRIADHLRNVKLVILNGEDHGSYIENSEIMGKLLIDFFKTQNT